MPLTFGATVDGVRALLPHRRIDATSKPSEADVAVHIGIAGNWLAGRIRGLDLTTVIGEEPPGTPLTLADQARSLVELGAASLAEDASFPERAAKTDSSYGTVLWDKFLAGIDELLEAAGVAPDGDGGPAPGVEIDSPAYYFPEPMFRRAQRF